MSSIRRVQTERLLEDVVQTLYSQGEKPMFSEVSRRLSEYFAEHPAGLPLELPTRDAIAAGISSTEEYNRLLSHLAINLDVLYESSLRQVEEVVDLTSSLQSHLNRLKGYRSTVAQKIDDYLMSMYNTDGYYFLMSDNFATLDGIDVNMSSAQVDTTAGIVGLPSLSGVSSAVPASLTSDPTIDMEGSESGPLDYEELAPFTGALEDSLDNILWAFETTTTSIEEVVAVVTFQLGDQRDPVSISKLDITPYGATPVQVYMETRNSQTPSASTWSGFGNRIQTGTSKMVFSADSRDVTSVRLTLRKTRPDYSETSNGNIYYKYIFGARELLIAYHMYDAHARLVSKPLSIPGEFSNDMVIDAVSLSVDEEVPYDCDAAYYVGSSTGMIEEQFDEINWKKITPLESREQGRKVIRFDGARTFRQRITEDPAVGDLELLPIVTTGPVADRNPSPLIIPGLDIYRIANIESADNVLLNSLKLTEGVNTTKIYSKPIDMYTEFEEVGLEYWSNIFRELSDDLTVDYGRTDTGNEFFYGGDIGVDGRDVFVETYLHADQSYPTFLDELQKVDSRSATWDVKAFLNGKPIGHLPPNRRKSQIPWNITRGLNHIVLLIRIPSAADVAVNNVFVGSIALMGNERINDYGSIWFDEWNYVNFFTMKYNETGAPKTFTIHDGQIISRRKPTTNFRISYARSNISSPEYIRFRADFSRERNAPTLTPTLRSYGVRFSYGED